MQKNIVIDRHGTVRRSCETIADAASEVLGYDGHQYEIREEDGLFRLYVSQFSRNSTAFNGLRPSVFMSFLADRDAAEAEIFEAVVARASYFNGQDVMDAADYAAALQGGE